MEPFLVSNNNGDADASTFIVDRFNHLNKVIAATPNKLKGLNN